MEYTISGISIKSKITFQDVSDLEGSLGSDLLTFITNVASTEVPKITVSQLKDILCVLVKDKVSEKELEAYIISNRVDAISNATQYLSEACGIESLTEEEKKTTQS